MTFREPTYEEFTELMRKALAHEYSNYRPHVPQERVKWMCDNEPDELFNFPGMKSFCTQDGKNLKFEGLKEGQTSAKITSSGGVSFDFTITVRATANGNGWL